MWCSNHLLGYRDCSYRTLKFSWLQVNMILSSMWITKVLSRLCRIAGWSAALLLQYPEDRFYLRPIWLMTANWNMLFDMVKEIKSFLMDCGYYSWCCEKFHFFIVKSTFSKNYFMNTISVKRFGSRSGPSGLIWVPTVCEEYQKMTLAVTISKVLRITVTSLSSSIRFQWLST